MLRDYPKWGHTVFTTNFDDLLLKSILSLNHTARIFGEIISEEQPSLSPSYPQIVHLHGRHTGYNLLNTKNQITEWYNPDLKKAFAKHISDSNLIIVGYSGWDDMVMQTLKDWNDTNENLIRGNLYWIPYKSEAYIEEKVKYFLNSCPHLKTFVVINQENNLNADSFILSLCNSINKKQGSFAIYRKDILETAKNQHSFILEQLQEYPDDNPQIAIKLAEEAERKIADAEITKSLELLNDALEIISQPDIPIDLKATVGKKIGVLLYKLGYLDKAKPVLSHSLDFFNQIAKKDTDIELETAENKRILAEILINEDDFDNAYKLIISSIYESKSVLFKDALNKKANVNWALSKLCRVYIHLLKGNLNTVDNELREINEMIEIFSEKFNILGKINQINGCYYLIKNNFEEAQNYFEISSQCYSKNNNEIKNIILNKIYVAYLHFRKKDFDSAFSIIKKAKEDFIHLGDKVGENICLNAIADFDSLKKSIDISKIEESYNQAANGFESIKSNYNLINILVDIYNLKKSKGQNEDISSELNKIEKINIKPHQYYKYNHKEYKGNYENER